MRWRVREPIGASLPPLLEVPPLPDDHLQTWTVVLTSEVGMSAPRGDAGAVSIGDRLALPGKQ